MFVGQLPMQMAHDLKKIAEALQPIFLEKDNFYSLLKVMSGSSGHEPTVKY